jgi:hypothetical protein
MRKSRQNITTKSVPANSKVNIFNPKINRANVKSRLGGICLRRQMASCVLRSTKLDFYLLNIRHFQEVVITMGNDLETSETL